MAEAINSSDNPPEGISVIDEYNGPGVSVVAVKEWLKREPHEESVILLLPDGQDIRMSRADAQRVGLMLAIAGGWGL